MNVDSGVDDLLINTKTAPVRKKIKIAPLNILVLSASCYLETLTMSHDMFCISIIFTFVYAYDLSLPNLHT